MLAFYSRLPVAVGTPAAYLPSAVADATKTSSEPSTHDGQRRQEFVSVESGGGRRARPVAGASRPIKGFDPAPIFFFLGAGLLVGNRNGIPAPSLPPRRARRRLDDPPLTLLFSPTCLRKFTATDGRSSRPSCPVRPASSAPSDGDTRSTRLLRRRSGPQRRTRRCARARRARASFPPDLDRILAYPPRPCFGATRDTFAIALAPRALREP